MTTGFCTFDAAVQAIIRLRAPLSGPLAYRRPYGKGGVAGMNLSHRTKSPVFCSPDSGGEHVTG